MRLNLLLDTHALLWWLGDIPVLSREAQEAIADPLSNVYVSAACVWEIAIKKSLGKLRAPENLEQALAATAFHELPISIGHATEAGALPMHHNDPFDRMLVAQARIEKLTLVTRDEKIAQYGVSILRARAFVAQASCP